MQVACLGGVSILSPHPGWHVAGPVLGRPCVLSLSGWTWTGPLWLVPCGVGLACGRCGSVPCVLEEFPEDPPGAPTAAATSRLGRTVAVRESTAALVDVGGASLWGSSSSELGPLVVMLFLCWLSLTHVLLGSGYWPLLAVVELRLPRVLTLHSLEGIAEDTVFFVWFGSGD